MDRQKRKVSTYLCIGLWACTACTPALAVSIDKLQGEAYSDVGQIVAGYDAVDHADAAGSYLT